MLVKLHKNKGITLIALIITVIVLLILAGVAVNMLVGENGILSHTQTSTEKYSIEAEKEALKLEILNIQTEILKKEGRKATLEDLQARIDLAKYEIEMHYEPIATSTPVASPATYSIVNRKGTNYYFTVDDKLIITNVEVIGVNEVSNKIKNFEISASKINGTYIEVDASNAVTEDGSQIKEYKYFLNDVEKGTSRDSSYVLNDLNLNTEYRIKVIAVDNEGMKKTSNEIRKKTEAVEYLYNNGDECEVVTGGWIVEGIAMSDTSALQPNLLKKEYLNVSLTSPSGYSSGVLKTENNLDYSNYKKMYIKYSASMGHYSGGACFGLSKNTMDYVPGTSLKTLCYWNAINNVTEEIDLNGMQPEDTLKIYMQVHQLEGQVSMTIYQIWLEK